MRNYWEFYQALQLNWMMVMFSEMKNIVIFTGEIMLPGICFKIFCKNKNAGVHSYWNAQNVLNTNTTKCWWGCVTVGTLIHCQWKYKMMQPLWKPVWPFFFFFQNSTNIYHITSSHASWYLSKGVENLHPHRKLHINVCSSFIHNCQNLEASKIPFSKWMDKKIVVHRDNGILFSAKKRN